MSDVEPHPLAFNSGGLKSLKAAHQGSLFEIARVFVRFDHVARRIVNAIFISASARN